MPSPSRPQPSCFRLAPVMSVPSCLVSSVSWIEENILNDGAAPERSIVCRQRLTGDNLGFMSPFVRSPNMNNLSIRTMRPDEISIAVNWAAAEGWNPGLADDACFAAVDPESFLTCGLAPPQ